eukprot:CAMPEP_0174969968 /NCGR_PEP_ID=MMETSP0004_2-20121128/9083_1 /TAXON_ID=420556 /ORGANISM="Ochromonas sp., Strain CCMP1393" /LENGTH=444 /DNA_ID=CAMNT_0016219569 /DNA_START=140 /DNA_END=1474 /DNA_ORIENTATION=-
MGKVSLRSSAIHVDFCILYVLVALVLSIGVHSHPYDVVRLENGTAFLITNGGRVAKRIDGEDTITTLGFNMQMLSTVSPGKLNALRIGDAVPPLKQKDNSMDEIIRIAVMKSAAVNGNLMKGSKWLGMYINPSVVPWKGRLLLATGLAWGEADGLPSDNTIAFRWYNFSTYRFEDEKMPYLCIYGDGLHKLSKNADLGFIIGQDPRIVLLEDGDRFQIFFTNPFESIARMGMAEVAINHTSGCPEVVNRRFTIHPQVDPHEPQKNWSPFRYRNETLLIQNINPLIVVKLKSHSSDESVGMVAYKHSHAAPVHIEWPYGTIRGGTNAVYLPMHDRYLAFFHTSGHLSEASWMKTYLMGAYTFSAESPFKLLSVSPMPIMPESFYTGPWDHIKQRHIDYCVFPIQLTLESNARLMLSLGWQDMSGHLMYFNTYELLDTLVDIKPAK